MFRSRQSFLGRFLSNKKLLNLWKFGKDPVVGLGFPVILFLIIESYRGFCYNDNVAIEYMGSFGYRRFAEFIRILVYLHRKCSHN